MDQENKHWWLYVLKLENSKWYVGITSKSPEERFAEHLAGRRAAYWTMAHKPVGIELVEDLGVVNKEYAEEYENKITRSLMEERGLNNVRGGDLRDVGDYIRRFGKVWDKNGWSVIAYVVLLNLIILWLVMYIYEWNLWVFVSYVLLSATVILFINKFHKSDKA